MEKFDCFSCEKGGMGILGSNISDTIQENSIPDIDLFIRESMQNSGDAHLPMADCIPIDFNVSSFSVDSFLSFFPENIKTAFLQRKKDYKNDFLSFGDKNTTGLTGSLLAVEDNERLSKLVYGVMRKHDDKGSGGSWGIGKTVYFRLTQIGFIIYYSRISTDTGYQERLIIVLGEDQSKPSKLIDDPLYSGYIYCGQHNENAVNKTSPITDPDFIHRFLAIFNIKPYENDETGTEIIIPFIDKEKLCKNRNTYELEGKELGLPFTNTLEEYLTTSILRWYFPRLTKMYLKGNDGTNPSYFSVRVNGNDVEQQLENYPLFYYYTKLYFSIVAQNPCEGVVVKEIIRERGLTSPVMGKLAYMELTEDQLGLLSPKNLPYPYMYANCKPSTVEDAANKFRHYPIFAFMRQPGMILSYETSGDWTNNSSSEDLSKYFISLFVLNSNNRSSKTDKSWDDYCRECEKGVHDSWQDIVPPDEGFRSKYIACMQSRVAAEITNALHPKTADDSAYVSKTLMSYALAKYLPQFGYGKESGTDGSKGRGTSGTGDGKLTSHRAKVFDISDPISFVGKDRISKQITINFKEKVKDYYIELLISTSSGTKKVANLEKNGLPSPFSEIMMKGEFNSKRGISFALFKEPAEKMPFAGLKYHLLLTPNQDCYGIYFENDGENDISLSLVIFVTLKDPSIQMAFSADQKEVKDEED